MSVASRGRQSGDRQMVHNARVLYKRMMSAEQRMLTAQQQRDIARDELLALHRKECARFERELPMSALLLDVLSVIEIEDDDVWRWNGMRNNKGVPTLREERQEKSVVRFLAIELGVIDESTFGTLYPSSGDADDVNPWHRTLRESSRPTGNRWRFDTTRESD